MTTPFEDKEGLLAAIASGGTAGAQAYKDAQAQLAAQQAAATQAALRTSIGLSPEAEASVANLIGQGYAPRQASLTQNAAISQDFFNKLGASTNAFYGKAQAVLPVLEAQLAAKLAAQSSGGGGGKGRGGGGGGGSETDPFTALRKQFGSEGNLKDYIVGLTASKYGQERSLYGHAADVATELGVPAELASQWFPDVGTAYLQDARAQYNAIKQQGYKRRQAQAYLRQTAQTYPGKQVTQIKQVLSELYPKRKRGK